MNIVNAVFTCFPERERERGQGLGSWFSEVFLPFYELEKSAAPGKRLARRPPVNLSEYFGCKNQLVLPGLLYVNRSVYDSPVVWTFIRIIGQLWSRKCWVIIIKKRPWLGFNCGPDLGFFLLSTNWQFIWYRVCFHTSNQWIWGRKCSHTRGGAETPGPLEGQRGAAGAHRVLRTCVLKLHFVSRGLQYVALKLMTGVWIRKSSDGLNLVTLYKNQNGLGD